MDFIRQKGETALVGASNSPHTVSYEVKLQPVVVNNLNNGLAQGLFQDTGENNLLLEDNANNSFRKSNSTIVSDLGLEIISNGIDVTAENLAILLT
jgi:hypothetical protein